MAKRRKKAQAAIPVDDRFSPLLPAEDLASGRDYTVKTRIWRWKGGAWHFADLPSNMSGEIKQRFGAVARGFGSIRVRVRIGDTEWGTSLFPNRKKGNYMFMIKAAVRKAEDVGDGDRITATVHIL